MRKFFAGILATAALFAVGTAAPAGAQSDTETKTIVEVAAGNPDLSTLVKAVTAAKLVDTLSGKGPFTVFAPTNAAFDALPKGTLDTLLADPSGALTDILKLHVIGGAVDSTAAVAAAGTNVDTLGGPVMVELRGKDLYVGGAKVTTADIKTKNGIVHVIDAVITKPAAAAPTSVQTGDDGLAASTSGPNPLLYVLVGLGVMGVTTASVSVARARRRN
jgi:uncharacterized surface protein with fasciclin (FAS1) repeats